MSDYPAHESYTGDVIKEFGNWLVTTGGIECRFGNYDIHWSDVWDPKWKAQVKQNNNLPARYEDFLQALHFARMHFPAAEAYDPEQARWYQQQHQDDKIQ